MGLFGFCHTNICVYLYRPVVFINLFIYFLRQVVTGGQYDVDVTLENPKKEIIYRQVKSQFDTHTFTATVCITKCNVKFLRIFLIVLVLFHL